MKYSKIQCKAILLMEVKQLTRFSDYILEISDSAVFLFFVFLLPGVCGHERVVVCSGIPSFSSLLKHTSMIWQNIVESGVNESCITCQAIMQYCVFLNLFVGVRAANLLHFLCCIFVFVCLCFVSCVPSLASVS